MSVCASAGLMHHLGLVCFGLKVYINLPLDTEMLFHNPHIPESLSKMERGSACPAAASSEFLKTLKECADECSSSSLQKFYSDSKMFCAVEISLLDEGYINHCSFPPCLAHRQLPFYITKTESDAPYGSFLLFFRKSSTTCPCVRLFGLVDNPVYCERCTHPAYVPSKNKRNSAQRHGDVGRFRIRYSKRG